MASSPKVTPQKDKMLEKGGSETPPDRPLLELSDAAVKKLIRSAKKRGYVTHDQINSLSKEVNSERIEGVLAMFSDMGVNVVETEEASEEGEEPREEAEEEAGSARRRAVTAINWNEWPRSIGIAGRDQPVRAVTAAPRDIAACLLDHLSGQVHLAQGCHR